MMKRYRVKQEHWEYWGECDENTVVTDDDIAALATTWEKDVAELMEQVEEIKDGTMTLHRLTAATFSDALILDYAQSLVEGVTNIEPATSAIVSRLVEWTRDRGYEISREDAAEVLVALIEEERQHGWDENE